MCPVTGKGNGAGIDTDLGTEIDAKIGTDIGRDTGTDLGTEIGTDISRASELLRGGALVAIPTETVYGLAANALDDAAAVKIFAAKQRPRFDPLIVHLRWLPEERSAHSDDAFEAWLEAELLTYVHEVPTWARRLARRFWPGPLTLILPRKPCIPDIVTAGLDTVGIRVPRHPVTQCLLQKLAFPLAAPSANPFGYISPTTPHHVVAQLGDVIPYVLDGGACHVGLESTIVGEQEGKPTILRLGGLGRDAIEAVIGPVQVNIQSTSNPRNPGSLDSHYAPRTPLHFGDCDYAAQGYRPEDVGMLRFAEPLPEVPAHQQIVLSAQQDTSEAARHLFGALRYLDGLGQGISQEQPAHAQPVHIHAPAKPIRAIFAEACPERGLGPAINDRLRRAAHQRR